MHLNEKIASTSGFPSLTPSGSVSRDSFSLHPKHNFQVEAFMDALKEGWKQIIFQILRTQLKNLGWIKGSELPVVWQDVDLGSKHAFRCPLKYIFGQIHASVARGNLL